MNTGCEACVLPSQQRVDTMVSLSGDCGSEYAPSCAHGDEVVAELDSDALFGDLDELGQATAKDAPLPFLFCVVSWGAAATQWLANTLNAHPDIFAPIAPINSGSGWQAPATLTVGNICAFSEASHPRRVPAATSMACRVKQFQICGPNWATSSTALFSFESHCRGFAARWRFLTIGRSRAPGTSTTYRNSSIKATPAGE
jgi:hypothetical protein